MGRSRSYLEGWIALLSEDARDETQRARLIERMQGDPEAQADYAFHLRLTDAARDAPLPASSRVYYDGALEAIHRRMPSQVRCARRRPFWKLSRSAAASLFVYSLLGLCVGMCWFGGNGGMIGERHEENGGWRPNASNGAMYASLPDDAPQPIYVAGLGVVADGDLLHRMTELELADLGIVREHLKDGVRYVISSAARRTLPRGFML